MVLSRALWDAPEGVMAVFENYPVGEWKVGKLAALKFPVCEIQETGGNRLVERERPYRDGAKLDDTGSKAKRWSLKVKFENSIEEPGLDPSRPLYPDILNELIASFDIHETGNLVVPTRGKVRARAESYTRDEVDSERDGAMVTFVFVEDNEDSVGNQQFEQLQVNASVKRVTEQTVFSASSEGVWDTSLADLNDFASELEAFANAPGDVYSDVDTQVGIVVGAANRVLRSNTHEGQVERNPKLADPELSLTYRKLEETRDIAGRARGESFAGRPRAVAYYVKEDTDLFQISSTLQQQPEDVMSLNPNVDPLYVPARSVVLVLEQS